MVVEHIFFITAFCVGGLLFFFFFNFIWSSSVNFFLVGRSRARWGISERIRVAHGKWPVGMIEAGTRETHGVSSETVTRGPPPTSGFQARSGAGLARQEKKERHSRKTVS